MNTPVILRLLDIVLSILGLFIASLVMLLILIVGLINKNRPIFRQERIGRNKALFTLFKFRTMALDTPSVPTHLAQPYMVTPLGSFLRRTKLDELPQLWNVLKGEMSQVEPRPGPVHQI